MLVVDRVTPVPTPLPAMPGEGPHHHVTVADHPLIGAGAVQIRPRGGGLQVTGGRDVRVDQRVDVDRTAVGVQDQAPLGNCRQLKAEVLLSCIDSSSSARG